MTDIQDSLVTQQDTQRGRFLTFSLGEEDYGIEISYVIEIIGMQTISKIPQAPEYIKGIINLRGKIVPLIDVRLKLSKPPVDYTDRTCIIVIETSALSVGLIVDSIAEVISIEDESIAPLPDGQTGIHNRYIQGIGKIGDTVKLLLDCEKLLDGYDDEQPISETA